MAGDRSLYISISRESRERIFAFLLVATILAIVNTVTDISWFPYDSGLYWDLSKPAPIGTFPETFRGYLWPYMLMPIHALDEWIGGNAHYGYRIISSLMYSLLLTNPVSDFFKRCFGGILSIARRSFIALALIIVFPGLFLNPLSDLPAVLLLVCGILLADSRGNVRWPLACICSGALVGAAYNARTIYIVSFVVLLALLPLFFYRGRSIRVRSSAVICFLLGTAIVLIPQALINERIHGFPNPLVLTGPGSTSLMTAQLYWGVTIQRYETSILKTDPAPSLFYADPAGEAFNAKHLAYRSPPTITNYLKAVYANPLFFVGLYGRHFVNGIDVRDGMVYTAGPSTGRTLWSLLCVTLFVFCTFVLCTRVTKKWSEWAYVSPILITVACIIPGAVETRFLMPLYLVLFGVVATCFELGRVRVQLRTHWPTIIAGYVLAASISLAITSSTMAGLQYVVP